jgi:hypothetical protein
VAVVIERLDFELSNPDQIIEFGRFHFRSPKQIPWVGPLRA